MQACITELDIGKLHNFITEKTPRYPITAGEMALFARQYDVSVADFYELFPADMTFASEEDLLERSEQVKLLEDGGAFQKRLPTYEEFDSY